MSVGLCVYVWAADWITKASGEYVYSFSLTISNRRDPEGGKGGSSPLCTKVKEQLVDIDRGPRPGNNLWKCFMDLKGWYSEKKDSLESACSLSMNWLNKIDYNIINKISIFKNQMWQQSVCPKLITSHSVFFYFRCKKLFLMRDLKLLGKSLAETCREIVCHFPQIILFCCSLLKGFYCLSCKIFQRCFTGFKSLDILGCSLVLIFCFFKNFDVCLA